MAIEILEQRPLIFDPAGGHLRRRLRDAGSRWGSCSQCEEAAVHDLDGAGNHGAGDRCRGLRLAAYGTSEGGTVITSSSQPIGAEPSEDEDHAALKSLPEQLVN